MKKLLFTAVLTALVLPATAVTPGKLSLWDGIAVPDDKTVRGLELGAGGNNGETVGAQIDLLWAKTQNFTGWQASFIFSEAGNMTGLQTALANKADIVEGLQWGAGNWVDRRITGAQLGLFNYAKGMTGLQLGFVNYAETIDRGLQIGLVNIAQNGWLPIMVFFNGKF